MKPNMSDPAISHNCSPLQLPSVYFPELTRARLLLYITEYSALDFTYLLSPPSEGYTVALKEYAKDLGLEM